jgi:hypothetical protein
LQRSAGVAIEILPKGIDRRRLLHAFLVADIASAIMFTAYAYSTDQSGLRDTYYSAGFLLIGVAFSGIAIAVFALPAFLALRFKGLVNLWSALTGGFVVGALMAALTERPRGLSGFIHASWDDHAVRRLCAFAAIGALSALSFWSVWNRKTIAR